MTIKRVKNIIGLCACDGCKKRLKICIETKFVKKDGNQIKAPFNYRKFWLCTDHAWEITHELINAGAIIEEIS